MTGSAEANPEFAVARWWSLIEAIATARQPSGEPAPGFSGRPVGVGAGHTTNDTRARVHEYIRSQFERHDVSEQAARVREDGSLWETINGWIALRNAVQHYGRLDLSDAKQQSRPWFGDAKRARAVDTERGVHYQLSRIAELATLLVSLGVGVTRFGTPLQ